jgi:hypothetical protein
VFLVLFGSYAYFWQSRDWNTASRLMLTYALVERGTVSIDGFEDQTRDRARVGAHYYSDKLPGLSVLAIPPYWSAKRLLGLPDHPRFKPGFTHWQCDYWASLGTVGLATAFIGSLLTSVAGAMGCGPRRAALIGLAYGLATPAFAYATMPYGHQVSAACLFSALVLLWRARVGSRNLVRASAAGFLAALAAAVELQVAPLAVILGAYCLTLVILGKMPRAAIAAFVAMAAVPVLGIVVYNWIAFGSPWEMGYFHEDLQQFQLVHNAKNRLGLLNPDWSRARPLLWGGYRGLFFYAPILMLAIPGWIVLAVRRQWELLLLTVAVCAAMFLVNLSYPEWTGGWSTGPRLLVPMIPFAMIPVAAVMGIKSRWVAAAAIGLALWGGIVVLMFVGVGGRLPNLLNDRELADPFYQAVLPLWRGDRAPYWWLGDRFARNVVSVACGGWVSRLRPEMHWLQFVPLVAFQALGVMCLVAFCRERRGDGGVVAAGATTDGADIAIAKGSRSSARVS